MKDSQTYSDDGVEKMHEGFCIWLTGLSASGKTTLARLLEQALVNRGCKVEVLDGDVVRTNLSKGLGFSRADRETNLRRIAFVASLLVRHGVVVIVSAITPYQSIRTEVRNTIGEFVEVFLNCPLEICLQRDPKGLYRKALAGEIEFFTGITDPFETPQDQDIEVWTHLESPQRCLAKVVDWLEMFNKINNSPNSYLKEGNRLLEKPGSDYSYMPTKY
jgi:adenylylsulfate kinase